MNPSYYERIQAAVRLWHAPDDSIEEAARSTATALFNVSIAYFDRLGDRRTAANFASRFGGRLTGDLDAADDIIDFLTDFDSTTPEFVVTLLERLEDVASKPPDGG